MKSVALITIHGMGKIKPGYFRDLEEGVIEKLGSKRWDKVSFKNIQYAPILQGPQDKLWDAMLKEKTNELDALKIRQFFLFGFGDAGSLEYSAQKDPRKYLDVQKEIQNVLLSAFKECGSDPNTPIVLIAQSLGCQVISNYLWDAQNGRYIFSSPNTGPEANFLKLKSLNNLITTGCNIPIFVSGLDARVCFDPPSPNFTWDNYYDQDDVLGWPLRQLGKNYNIVHDHSINAGGILSSWNVASHGEYWSDKDVISAVSTRLMEYL
ncbi:MULTISPECIES: NYN domain-containing protein [Pseudomonas]|jgi:hypothetical protein|uniref:NYN domain-containing protein n=1 Tax=Pseudomonas sp. W17 TaxID=3144407 RepID=A0AAU7WM31_9PSED|nr:MULTISPECIES: NYN domain-containing protein [Pseudomonas]MDT9643318.1 NYN domain-containing protein [Pseudomonas sp. JV245A]QEN47899.1 hypothetical protein CLA18_15755 [Pseudomonas protegens]WRV88468.1 NYN domain-containing protein [Pseudomonas protegens]BAO62206.1 hypothetical protein PPC_2859 [Pseudomonas protegens Cab57]